MKDERRRHPAMEVSISGLSDGIHPFTFDVPASEIELDERFPGNVHVEGQLNKVSTSIAVEASIDAESVRTCDRCLAEMREEMEIPLILYYHEGYSDRPSKKVDDEQLRSLDPDQETIVLDDEVRETLLVNLPLKSLCREECRGICPRCGVDLNVETCRCEGEEIDPRWAKLQEVFRRNGEG